MVLVVLLCWILGRGPTPPVSSAQLPIITMKRVWTGIDKGNLHVVVNHAATQPLPNHLRAGHFSADLCMLTTCR